MSEVTHNLNELSCQLEMLNVMMVHRVLLVQRVVSYLLETGVVVLILKLCVVMMESTVVLKVCLFKKNL